MPNRTQSTKGDPWLVFWIGGETFWEGVPKESGLGTLVVRHAVHPEGAADVVGFKIDQRRRS